MIKGVGVMVMGERGNDRVEINDKVVVLNVVMVMEAC